MNTFGKRDYNFLYMITPESTFQLVPKKKIRNQSIMLIQPMLDEINNFNNHLIEFKPRFL